jgi:hypothetical protein
MIGDPALPTVAGLGFEPINEIGDIVEPATSANADAASRDGDGEMRFAGSGPPTSTTLRCWAIKPPPEASQVRVWRFVQRTLHGPE